jgi:hypothetical protein
MINSAFLKDMFPDYSVFESTFKIYLTLKIIFNWQTIVTHIYGGQGGSITCND